MFMQKPTLVVSTPTTKEAQPVYCNMKTSTLILSFILFAFSTTSFCAADGSVLDTDGDILRPNTDYYILPVTRGLGGGLVTVRARNKTCPLDVGQAQSELDRGFPVNFTPQNSKVGFVSQSANLHISFPYIKTTCHQAKAWNLANDDGELVVSAGGKPGSETSSDWFRIASDGEDYKFVHCPLVCSTCLTPGPVCEGIGISIKNGIRRLVLNNEPFKVVFKKAVRSQK